MIKPPRVKRYGWFRLYNGFFDHPKWRLVARHTGVSIPEVHSIVGKLMEAANKARPRGSIAEFSILETAAALDLTAADVGRVYAALQDIGWIDRQYLSTWDERQPDEDPTRSTRQRRYYLRRKKIAQEILEQNQRPFLRVETTPDSDIVSKKEAPETEFEAGHQTSNYEEAQRWRQAHLPLKPVLLKQRGNQ